MTGGAATDSTRLTAPTDDALEIALAQLPIEAGDVEANVASALEAIDAAADAGADLLALPELFSVGYFAFDAYERAAEPLEGPTLTRLREAAADRDLALLAGSVVEDLAATESVETPAEEGLANTAALFDADGDLALVYRKHHLFGYDSVESDLLVPGERLEVAALGGFTVGVTTCYDLRFPALYRRLVDLGATLVLVPSAWPYPRLEHWQVLSRARAIENHVSLAAVNGVGSVEGSTLLGHSTVYDPWGTPVASSGDDPALVTAALDPGEVDRVRETFPTLRDRRP